MMIERSVFEWYLGSIEFAESYLQLPGTEVLKWELCSDLIKKPKKSKGVIVGIAKYAWLVEHIIAPLAFLQREENGEPCSVKKPTYKLKVKECKDILAGKPSKVQVVKPDEEGHEVEL